MVPRCNHRRPKNQKVGPRPQKTGGEELNAGKQKEDATMKRVKVETGKTANNKQRGVMQRIMAGLLAGAVISGTAWAQTPVAPTQGSVAGLAPVAGPALVAAPAPVSVAMPKTWVDYLTLKGDVRLRYETINDDSTAPASGPDLARKPRLKT
jgi:hypothetical protein